MASALLVDRCGRRPLLLGGAAAAQTRWALADRIADDMSEYIWRVRERFANGKLPQPDEAARRVRSAVAAGEVPVAVARAAVDVPVGGGGGP